MYTPGICSSRRGFGSLLRGVMEMLSTPPPIAASLPPFTIWYAANAIDCRPEEQKRLRVTPATEVGRPASRAETLAMLCPCGPWGCPQPRITSSTSRGSSWGVLRNTSLIQCAARSSGRVRLNDPRNDLASAVRELATMTASLMKSPMLLLRGRHLLFIELGKCFTGFRQALQQRSRRPEFSVLLMEFANALIDLLQSHRVGIPHRPTAIGGKSVTVEIDDVDVDCPQCVSLFENPRSLIYQRIDAAIDDLRGRDLPLRDSSLRAPLPHQRSQLGINARAPVFVVEIPSPHGFLTVMPHFTKTIFGERLADSGFFQMAVLLANAPAHVETCQVAGGQRAHRHAEIDKRPIYRLHLRAFFYQELRFPAIRAKHAVAYKAAAVAYQHSDFAQLLRELHAGGNHFFARLFPAHNLEQSHHVRRTEEVRSDHRFRPRGGPGDFIYVERRRVARQNRALSAGAVQVRKHGFLQRHAFENRLDHHVHTRERIVVAHRRDQLQTLIHECLREAPTLYRARVVLPDFSHTQIERRLIHILQQHRNARVGKHHRDPSAHRAGANDRHAVHRQHWSFPGNIGNLRHLALAKENMDERFRLIGEKTFGEKFCLRLAAFLER